MEIREQVRWLITLQANHCPGAVMFFIEGDGKAVLYTGDVRGKRNAYSRDDKKPQLTKPS